MLIFENFLSYSHFWDYQQSTKKHNSVGHLQRQQFSFTKTNEYLSVSKNSQVFTSKLKDEVYVLSPRFPGVCFFKIITKYSLNIALDFIRLIKFFIYFLQIQELGLQQPYCNDQGTYIYLRKFMALPFLPEQEIPPMFQHLRQQATTAPLQQFVAYVSEIWITNSTWPPSSWSVYMMATRSKNDVEGWHHGLHRRAAGRQNLNLYLLIDLLHQEAWLTALRIRLVSEKKLTRIQRKK